MNEDPKFFVPKGWTRGHALRCMAKRSRYALFQAFDPAKDFDPTLTVVPNNVAAIEFNSREDAQAFIDWWHAT